MFRGWEYASRRSVAPVAPLGPPNRAIPARIVFIPGLKPSFLVHYTQARRPSVPIPRLGVQNRTPSPVRRFHMEAKRFTSVALVVGLLMCSVPLWAHHGFAAFYTTKQVTLKGTVTEWKWANPHCLLRTQTIRSANELFAGLKKRLTAETAETAEKKPYGRFHNPSSLARLT